MSVPSTSHKWIETTASSGLATAVNPLSRAAGDYLRRHMYDNCGVGKEEATPVKVKTQQDVHGCFPGFQGFFFIFTSFVYFAPSISYLTASF